MQTHTTIRSYPAILGGSIAAAIAWATLTRDAGFADITLDHIQAAALVGLTILAGHLAAQAWQQLRLISAAGLVGLAVLGSALTVYNGMGSRAETRDVKMSSASLTEGERLRIGADLTKTTKLVSEAEAWVATECRTGKGPKCDGVNFVLRQRQASQKALADQLRNVGPAQVAEPKAAQVALLAAQAGYDGSAVRQLVSALEPLAFPLFFEFLAIVLFGYGLGHSVETVSRPVSNALTFEDTKTLTDPELEQLRKLLTTAGRALNNNEVAELAGVTKSEATKRVTKAVMAGLVSRHRIGKEVAITLH